jgi:hypothetical protein
MDGDFHPFYTHSIDGWRDSENTENTKTHKHTDTYTHKTQTPLSPLAHLRTADDDGVSGSLRDVVDVAHSDTHTRARKQIHVHMPTHQKTETHTPPPPPPPQRTNTSELSEAALTRRMSGEAPGLNT